MPIMSQRGYARHRGCSLRAVQKAIEDGRLAKAVTPERKIDSEIADREWAANTNPGQQRGSGSKHRRVAPNVPGSGPAPEVGRTADGTASPLVQARTDREHYEAKLAEIKYKQAARELVPISQVNAHVAGMIVEARDILLRIGPELRDRLAQETTPHRCEALVMGEINRALGKLAEYRSNAA